MYVMTAIHDRSVKFLSSLICTLIGRAVPSTGLVWPWQFHWRLVSPA
jgi:hypothetical protein